MLETEGKEDAAFILAAINDHKASDAFKHSLIARRYYEKQNEEVLKRLNFLSRRGIKVDIKFHKLCSGFFPQMVDHWTTYTLGDGLTIDSRKKEVLGQDFEYQLLHVGVLNAALAGVCYGFWNLSPDGKIENNRVVFFPVEENNGLNGAFPLLDERTGNIKLFVRFWQIEGGKPIYAELYDEKGITEYTGNSGGGGLTKGRFRPYRIKIYENELEHEVVSTEGYPEIPVYPLHVNKSKKSELTEGLKSYIDAYDFVASDLVNDITTKEGIKAVVQNYGGENLQDLFDKLQAEIFPAAENAKQDVAYNVVETPFQSKQALLDLAERRIYEDFPIPVLHQSTRAITATEIKASREKFDIKADILEWWACKFVESILKLNGVDITPNEVKFKRRTLINDTEIVNNISTMVTDGYIDSDAAIDLNPLIPLDEKEALKKRVELADMGAVEEDDEDNDAVGAEPEEPPAFRTQ